MSQNPARFLIFEGELSDAPGRYETWTEHLTLLGNDSWEVEVTDTDFSVTGKPETFRAQYSSVDLIEWLRDRDGDNPIAGNPPSRVGNRLRALERYARSAGLSRLLTIIDRVRRGNWPPKPKAPRVLRVSGVTEFGRLPYGRGPKDKFLVVDTENGTGIMAIPIVGQLSAMYWLGTSRYPQCSWKCRLRKELVKQIQSLLQAEKIESN